MRNSFGEQHLLRSFHNPYDQHGQDICGERLRCSILRLTSNLSEWDECIAGSCCSLLRLWTLMWAERYRKSNRSSLLQLSNPIYWDQCTSGRISLQSPAAVLPSFELSLATKLVFELCQLIIYPLPYLFLGDMREGRKITVIVLREV
jgi:hypothetical protein